MRLHFLLLFSFLIQSTFCERLFRLGRSKGGNLGLPNGVVNLSELPTAKWFKQRLDHSSPSDTRTWKQRYFVNDSFFDPNVSKNVFLMIGGEGAADPRWAVQGTWLEYARKFKALCFLLEHRYYGESHPTEDTSVKNLQYLSSDQALADIANFIPAMNRLYNVKKNIKWTAFGGSYPGSLAAWVRVKYPHLVSCAVSSSGPLLAKTDFIEYYEVVINAIIEKTGDNNCIETIKSAHKEIEIKMKTDRKVVEEEYKVCTPFDKASEKDINNFYSTIADDFADLVQYNEDNRISSAKFTNLTINNVCEMLTGESNETAFSKLAYFNSMMLEKTNQDCLDYKYENMIDELRNVTWGSDEARQWMYQTCTEFGFYQTSNNASALFGNYFTLDFFIEQCEDVFGTKYNKNFINSAVEWTNKNYGGLDIAATRVVFVHGSVDPWHALGITSTVRYNAPAIYIKGTAHCANMYPPSENDSSDLIQARIEIEQFLATWLGLP